MKFRTHNDGRVDTSRVFLNGYIQATRVELEVAFGTAEEYEGGSKVTTIWEVQFENGAAATIYDWKRGAMPAMNEVISWHVGTADVRHVALVHEAFRAAHGLNASARKAA